MNLKFDTRQGDRLTWERNLTIETADGNKGPFRLHMISVRERFNETTLQVDVFHLPNTRTPVSSRPVSDQEKTSGFGEREFRLGQAEKDGKALWTGAFTTDGPPLRAFAVASGLCDQSGDSSKLSLPTWASS